jgi:hypothetical protein
VISITKTTVETHTVVQRIGKKSVTTVFTDTDVMSFTYTDTDGDVAPPPPPPAACADGLDNDADGYIDFPADIGCSDSADTDEFNATQPPPSGDLANVWIDTNGGSCTRSATPVAYSDAAACGPSFDQAWDAMQSGDVARIVAGVYPHQDITGDKTATTKLIGASKASVIVRGNQDCVVDFGWFAVLCARGANLYLENVTLDSGPNANWASSSRIAAANVTYVNVDLVGDFPAMGIVGDGFKWLGGSHGKDGFTPPPYVCGNGAGQPITLNADNVLIDGVRFNPKYLAVVNGCTPHIEDIRLEGGSNFTLRSSRFVGGGDEGSGHIFSSVVVPGVRIESTIFEALAGTYSMQVVSADGWVFRNNRFDQPPLIHGGTPAQTCGNTGAVPASWTPPCP